GPPPATAPAAPTRVLPAPAGAAPSPVPEGGAQAVESAPVTAPSAPARAPDETLYREVPEQQSFAEMFEESEKNKKEGSAAARKMPRIGEKVIGRIFQLGADTAFVSLGGRSEAMIDLKELQDEEGILRSGVGDEIEAHVIQTGAKGIVLSRMLAKGSATLSLLSEARATGMPVEGMVIAAKKGGLEVAIGDLRAFCPLSQIDLKFVEKPEQYVGEKLLFRVMEVEDGNVVLSRRAVLELEQRKKALETRKTLEAGKVMRGKVTSVRDFGAFVDLGGVEGMIPVSEISHVRVGHPSEVLKVGDEVEVEVLRIEPAQPSSADKSKHKERITLSMRARQEDPFVAALRELKEGDRVKGKVVRLQPFGAFVELRPGVDGLIHVSAMSDRRIAHPRDVVQVGEEVEVAIEKIDPAEKRIGLRLVKDGEVVGGAAVARAEERAQQEQAPRPKVGQVVTGKVDRIEPYGVFVRFPGGKGLVPASETGTQRGTDLKRAFQLDQELKVSVLEIDASGKIRLSISEAERAEERAAVSEWTRGQKGGSGKGFGTLGDLLKSKLQR
ncbi:MAG TPA: S1 RNA-binding domain-containing protein, partial [Myxococcaceae bacterium]|nr:S1 RNA-binding domain-containing protein [Myxococcaceae bacterium]